jgi:Na+/proline symporter
MNPTTLFFFITCYFALLFFVARRVSGNATNESFFSGNKNSNWMIVTFGMIGTSLSGVTFISVPGLVGESAFSYFQIMLGQLLGYFVIAFILLPIFYKLNLTSIYDYLGIRLGPKSRKAGAWFFILSRCIGASARLYLVIIVLQETILDGLHVSYWISAAVTIAMVLLYTYQGGVKTIVWTDMLQTALMLTGLVISAKYLLGALDMSLLESLQKMDENGFTRIFSFDGDSRNFWLKQVVAGILITVAMTGMDQEMMQKNISVRTLTGSQKNVLTLAFSMMAVVLLFLVLGGLLYLYAPLAGITATGDRIFPAVVFSHMPQALQIVFVIALISALFPSADGALTALTSSFCIDIVELHRKATWSTEKRTRFRRKVHLGFALIVFVLLALLKWLDSRSIVVLILELAAITYGPLLGLFSFGIFTSRQVRDELVPYVLLAAPVLCFLLQRYQGSLFGDYQMGLEILALNGALSFLALWSISSPQHTANQSLSSSQP